VLYRAKRTRKITSDDPETLARQDVVIMGRGENPYRVGTAAHAVYEAEVGRVLSDLPTDYSPVWPRTNKKRKAGK